MAPVIAIASIIGAGAALYSANEQSDAYDEAADNSLVIGRMNARGAMSTAAYNAFMTRQEAKFTADYLEAQAIYGASVDNFNATQAMGNAARAREVASSEAERIRNRSSRLLGSQRADFAKSGVVVGSGTSQDVMLDSATQGELDALIAEYTGESEAVNEEFKAKGYAFEGASLLTMSSVKADMIRWSGENNAANIQRQGMSSAQIYAAGGNAAYLQNSAAASAATWQGFAQAINGATNLFNFGAQQKWW